MRMNYRINVFAIASIIIFVPYIAYCSDGCLIIKNEIENTLKNISSITAESIYDKSAAQQSARFFMISNEYSRIDIYLKQAEINKCIIEPFIASPEPYIKNANACSGAELYSSENSKVLCDRNTWTNTFKAEPINFVKKQ